MKNKRKLLNAFQKDEANKLFKEDLMSIRGGGNAAETGCTVCKKTCSMCVGGGQS